MKTLGNRCKEIDRWMQAADGDSTDDEGDDDGTEYTIRLTEKGEDR